MRCANKTMVNYEQNGCRLPISPPVIHHHCLLIIDAHQCATVHHNDCLIRGNKRRTGLSMDDKVVQQVFISSECQASNYSPYHIQKREIEREAKSFNSNPF